MYIKIFESRETAKSYTVIFPMTDDGFEFNPYIENENHKKIRVYEKEIYDAIDKLFKDKHAANQGG